MAQLNLPILDDLQHSQQILIAGVGGGYDIFSGLPLYYTLRALGKNVHLANYNAIYFPLDEHNHRLEILLDGQLVGVYADEKTLLPYSPESLLANWLKREVGYSAPVWILRNGGVVPIRKAYAQLCEFLNIDTLILVDGGMDSLMRGDEESPGTLVEDAISLAAAGDLGLPLKFLACVGFGTELGDGVSHYRILENMAHLVRRGALIGSCGLTPYMPAFEFYLRAVLYAFGQPKQPISHVNTQIVEAVQGVFREDRAPKTFISPLMSLYWFFDVTKVLEASLLVPALQWTETFDDALSAYLSLKAQLTLRGWQDIRY